MTPPLLALWLMHRLLPGRLREAISGDLEEEWTTSARPSRLRFWSLALRSIASCWLDGLRPDSYRRPRERPRHRGDRTVPSILQDLRFGARLMWRSPAFTFAAVATLALGIGANSAIFSVLNVLSLKPLPYREPSRVAFVLGWDTDANEMRFTLGQADFLDLQRQSASLASLAAYSYLSAALTGGDLPERVQAYRVTSNTFSLLGVSAALGRVFDENEEVDGSDDVAVISHGLWLRRFGGNPDVVGRRIALNGLSREIVGVMPPRFEYPVFNFKGEIWIPWQMREAERGQAAATGSTTVVGRLRDSVSYAHTQLELDVLMRTFAGQYPATNRGLGARLVEMGRLDDAQTGSALPIVLGTAVLVLILACANVANLLLARGVSRHRELALRAAIGASRLRLGRQLLIEGLLLALAGGVVGVVLAMLALDLMRASLPDILLTTQPNIEEIGVDRLTLAYTLLLTLVTSVMFGVLPAWRASRGHLHDALKESASAGGSPGTRRLRSGLVVAEVALATMLLIGAGLLVRSYRDVQRVAPGFEPAGVLTMAMTLPDDTYTDASQRRRFYEESIDRIERLPGVRAVGLVNVLPFSTYDRGARLMVDGAAPAEPGREPPVSHRITTSGYHAAMQIRLVDGRTFDRRDTADGQRVALVNETLARRYLTERSPVGRRVRLGGADTPWLTIVGVVGDTRHSALTEDPAPEVHVPMPQAPPAMMMLAIRGTARPGELATTVRTTLQAIDPTLPVYHIKTMEALVGDSMLVRRTAAAMMLLFSGLALTLAAIGVYGVVAYGVIQQTREFGVRIALGATPRDLLRLVLRSGIAMVGAGIGLGLLGALGLSRLLTGTLHGVSPVDPLTYAAVAGLLSVTGLLACIVPASRASATRPGSALRAG